MQVDVVMPQMGESIAEGTITRWLKQVGDKVERDEPIFEISTDKVDAEIPSPAAGIVKEIKNGEGDTVEVNAVVAVIETEGGAEVSDSAAPPSPQAAKEEPQATEPPREAPAAAAPTPSSSNGEDGRFVSPVVRKIAAEHGIDPSRVPGTGAGNRVTKKDILAYVESGAASTPPQAPTLAPAAAPATPALPSFTPAASAAGPPRAASTTQPDAPGFSSGEATVRVPMTQMRKVIAEHMVESRRTSAHVHSVFEVDLSRISAIRARHKQAFLERHGTKLTYMPFIIRAVCDGLRAWPILNASVEGDQIVYKRDLNIGIAVALDWGLIVPVVRNADDLSLAGLAKRVADLAGRSRSKKLSPDEVQGGTFTITNPGGYGGLYGLPIINQPQVGILGVGGIKRRPVVVGDGIAIRDMVLLSMSYDHRVVDGAVADQFLARVQYTLENFDDALV